MKSGYIRLEHNKHGVIAYERYDGASRRKVILFNWEKKYGPKFLECDIVITPDDPREVREHDTYKYSVLSRREKANKAFYH